MKRALLIVIAIMMAVANAKAQGGKLSQNPWAASRQGVPIAGVNVAVCQPLATTAASVTSNLAVYTMTSNPITAGFVSGMTIQVAGFTGGDTYFNAGTLANGTITGGLTILSVTSTTIVAALSHANGTAGTNGTVLQMGNASTSCAGLSSLFTDVTDATTQANPFLSDGLGNYDAAAVPGIYDVQLYGAGVTTTLRQIVVACPPSGTGCGGGGGGTITIVSGQVAVGNGVNTATGYTGFTFNSGTGNLSIPTGGNYQINGNNALLVSGTLFADVGVGYGIYNGTFTGIENTCMGALCLSSLTSGNLNTGLGWNVLNNITTGSRNFVFGATGTSSSGVTTGTDNVLIGFDAELGLTTGSNNISIGGAATHGLTGAASGNIIVGNNLTGYTPANSNQVDLGDVLTCTGINVPSTSNCKTAGNRAVFGTDTYTEGSAPTGSAGFDVCAGVSASHTIQCSWNGGTAISLAQVTPVPLTTGSGGGGVVTAPNGYFICTTTCTVTPPLPTAGVQFCVMNDDNVATVITLGALGGGGQYENTARTAYGTAGTGNIHSAGAAADKLCIIGRDTTHYLVVSFNGTWAVT